MSAHYTPACGICGNRMTPANSTISPELFLCDDCATSLNPPPVKTQCARYTPPTQEDWEALVRYADEHDAEFCDPPSADPLYIYKAQDRFIAEMLRRRTL